jgi:D-arabinose 1-dehydrogenase-like Zn-dependent alcohol dehydrogenase
MNEDGAYGIRVEAWGICHSDMFAKTGAFPGMAYPIVPGHEVAGVIDAVARASRGGWSDSASGSDGMEAIAVSARPAAAEIL